MNIAFDFESYYDEKCTIKSGFDNYVAHPDFDCYLVSFYAEDGWAWVGHPKDAPWEKLEGADLLAHNRNFEEPLTEHLQKLGIIPEFNFNSMECTADMSAYLGWGRSLQEATRNGLNLKMSKDTRSEMKGRKWEYQDFAYQRRVLEYAGYDSKASLWLGLKGMPLWPEHEKELSHETTRMCRRGLPVNPGMLDESIHSLRDTVGDALEAIPWAHGVQKGALSQPQFFSHVRSLGLDPPKSTAKDDPLVIRWMEENPKGAPVLEAMHALRGANSLLEKIETMRARVTPDNRLPFGMKYAGATPTLRDAGDSGFNTQNMPGKPMYGVDLRRCIEAGPGKILVISDLSQIEPRCIASLASEQELLAEARKGGDYYEAEARAMGLYDGPSPLAEHNPKLRKQLKINALGLQYMMSAEGLAATAGIPLSQAQVAYEDFHKNRPKLRTLGRYLKREMKRVAMGEGGDFSIELPSGRSLIYHNVMQGPSAEVLRKGSRTRLRYWEGMLLENITQAFARDVFMDRVLALRKAGHDIILRVHDEVVIETDIAGSEEARQDVQRIMSTSPDWCPYLPVAAETLLSPFYFKP